MVEQADTGDLKSLEGNFISVRVRVGAPQESLEKEESNE